MNAFRSPFFSAEENLEIAIGANSFKEEVIDNLRRQIAALRKSLSYYGMSEKSIDNVQYAHLHLDKL